MDTRSICPFAQNAFGERPFKAKAWQSVRGMYGSSTTRTALPGSTKWTSPARITGDAHTRLTNIHETLTDTCGGTTNP
jgi:hypothetical protein